MDQQLLDEVRHYFRLKCEQSGMSVDEAILELQERVNMNETSLWGDDKESAIKASNKAVAMECFDTFIANLKEGK